MSALMLLASLPLPILLLIVGCIFTFLLVAFLTIALVPPAGKRITSLLDGLWRSRDHLQIPPHNQPQKKSISPETGILHITLLIERIERSDVLPSGEESTKLSQSDILYHLHRLLDSGSGKEKFDSPCKVSLMTICGQGGAGKSSLPARITQQAALLQVTQQEALEQVTQDHYTLFLSIASGVVSNYDTAQDIVQDALEKAYRALLLYPEERLESMRLKPWVCKIVVHTALNHQKNKSKVMFLTLPRDWFAEKQGPLFERPEFQLLRSEMMSTLITVLDTLPEAQKDIVLLRFFEGCSIKEIAQQLSYPVGTVKSYLHRALASLRVVLEKEGAGAGDIATVVKTGSDLLTDITVLKDENMFTPEYKYAL